MKKNYYILSIILLSAAVLSLSSCLKDSRYVNFAGVGTIVDFPLGGQINFGADAITDAGDTVTRQFAVNVASPNLPKTATKITLGANDPAIITAYNTANTAVSYLPMPTGSYVLSASSVTIPAGQQYATVSVTFYKHLLDPSKSYMLPVKITDAGGLNISGNMGIHYFHFIGNVLAGPYTETYRRYNNGVGPSAGPPSTLSTLAVTFSPVSPTELTVNTNYAGIPYHLTFTQSGSTLSNFAVSFTAADIAAALSTAGVTIAGQPTLVQADPVKGIYEFSYHAVNSAGSARFIDETFTK